MRAPRYGARAGVKNGEFLEKDSAAGRCTARAARPRCRGAARSGLRSRAEAHCRLTAPRRARRPRGPRTGGGGGGWRVARGRRRAPRTRVSQTTNVRNSKVSESLVVYRRASHTSVLARRCGPFSGPVTGAAASAAGCGGAGGAGGWRALGRVGAGPWAGAGRLPSGWGALRGRGGQRPPPPWRVAAGTVTGGAAPAAPRPLARPLEVL